MQGLFFNVGRLILSAFPYEDKATWRQSFTKKYTNCYHKIWIRMKKRKCMSSYYRDWRLKVIETVQVVVDKFHLPLVCKLKALSCSEVSSSSSRRALSVEEGSCGHGGGEASSPRSMLGARMRISGTLISLNLRLQTCRHVTSHTGPSKLDATYFLLLYIHWVISTIIVLEKLSQARVLFHFFSRNKTKVRYSA